VKSILSEGEDVLCSYQECEDDKHTRIVFTNLRFILVYAEIENGSRYSIVSLPYNAINALTIELKDHNVGDSELSLMLADHGELKLRFEKKSESIDLHKQINKYLFI
jgi:hypothetical protein